MPAQADLVKNRYRLLERLGAGAMGEVWKAADVTFERRYVAVKLLKEEDSHRQALEQRERLLRLLREDEAAKSLTLQISINFLEDALGSGPGISKLRQRVAERAEQSARLSAEIVLGLYDELVGDPTYSENARMRASLRKRFNTEANALAQLHHASIVSISDYGDHDGVPFLVMNYVEGQTLQWVIQRGDRPRRDRILRLIEELCAGLAYAHKLNFVHRDIKPANLMIERTTDSLKILDFGVVRRLQQAPESTIGVPIGTLCYMSPEQIRGSATLDHRSDVFAVGAVFYELLSGQRAFPPGEGMTELMARIEREPPRPIRSLVPDLQPELEAMLDRALEKDPDLRYADLTVMQRGLNRVRVRLEEELEKEEALQETEKAPPRNRSPRRDEVPTRPIDPDETEKLPPKTPTPAPPLPAPPRRWSSSLIGAVALFVLALAALIPWGLSHGFRPEPSTAAPEDEVRRVQALIARGADAEALTAIAAHPNDDRFSKLLDDLAARAKEQVTSARTDARAATETPAYADAAGKAQRAEALMAEHRLQEAIPLLWEAAAAFSSVAPPPASSADTPASPVSPVNEATDEAKNVVGSVLHTPTKTHDVLPIYPQMAITTRMEGTVLIEATIGKEGTVIATRIMSQKSIFDQSALDAVRQWKYDPVLVDGLPVEVTITVRVNFKR